MAELLILEDRQRDQERHQALLVDAGHVLRFATNTTEAMEFLATKCVDAVLLNWDLPGAVEFVMRVRERFSTLPVLALGVAFDLVRASRARALGVVDFLIKPPERSRLRDAVEKALHPEAPPSLLAPLRERCVGASPALIRVLIDLARTIPRPGETVLLTGENGTGKEVLARAVHDLGPQCDSTWLEFNATTIPNDLADSALFGHEKGAFTGAGERKEGVFEAAGKGTLFLDEIGDLALPLQSKLLRVLQERRFVRVGSTELLSFEGRLICATNRDLVSACRQGHFRQDLYHRLAAHEFRLPPLRQRGDDRWLLASYFLSRYSEGREVRLSPEAKALLADYPFPGNVRELENIVRRSLVHCTGNFLLPLHLPVDVMEQREAQPEAADECHWPPKLLQLPLVAATQQLSQMFDRVYLPAKLRETRGNITQAARAAGIDPKTFRKRWEQADLGPVEITEERGE